MMNNKKSKKQMSRLRKKLMIYFLLISIVSISVSAEIILEMSSPRFKNQIQENFYTQLQSKITKEEYEAARAGIKMDDIFTPISDLRNRIILLLLVVSGCIAGAFYLFSKDIVSPMDDMVKATKKIADGDLTITVPVMSDDEIGQIGTLINSMNVNLQDMIMQIRQEISRYTKQIDITTEKIKDLTDTGMIDHALEEKKISASQFKSILKLGNEIGVTLNNMSGELAALQTFVDMYKTYSAQTEINQREIENAIKEHGKSKVKNNGQKA